MNVNEIKDLSVKELREKIEGLQQKLFNLRFQAKLGQLSNPLKIRMVRRDIARVRTVCNAKQTAN